MRTYLQLGKIGDILSILPILQDDFRNGEKPRLVISREYAHVVEGLDFLEPVIYPGHWQDLSGAILATKKRYSDVVIPQMHSESYIAARSKPSFQLDQWERCGRLAQWGHLELDLPRPQNHGIEIPQKPFILLADHSQSSPFEHVEDLASALQETFPSHRLVRLSSIKARALLDLLVIYDAADLLVTIDTMHLHLSQATKTPVIALATDKPSRWHGSAWHPRFAMHLRYGDYLTRKEQLLFTAKRCVNKQGVPAIHTMPCGHDNGYNLSILKVGDNLWKTHRHHPDPKSWRTELFLEVDSGPVTKIIPPDRYERHSFEDGRLFLFRGEPHISATVSRSKLPGQTGDFSPCVTGYGKLSPDGKITNWIEPRIGKNDWTSQEKNHVFYEYDGKLFVIYRCSPQQVIHQLDDSGNSVAKFITDTPRCSYGEPRGGTQPLYYDDNTWIRFVHVNQVNKKSDLWWQYHLAAVLMDNKPPFQIKFVSKLPIVSGDDRYFVGHKFWKPRVVIAYGVLDERDKVWTVAVGINDSACGVVKVHWSDLNFL